MKTLFALVRHNFKLAIGQKPLLFILITLLPILILLASTVLITYNNTFVDLGVSDADDTPISRAVGELLLEIDGIGKFSFPPEEMEAKFRDGTVNVGVRIGEGFEASLRRGELEGIQVFAEEGSETHLLVSSLLKNHLLNLRNIGRAYPDDPAGFDAAVEQYLQDSGTVRKEPLNDLYADYNNSNLLIGFLMMLIFFKAASVASTINQDRESNVYTRIFVAGVRAWQYHGANVLTNVLIATFQMLVSVLAMTYLINVSVGVRPFDLFLILSLTSAVAVAYGSFCVALFEQAEGTTMFANFSILLFVLLGGSFIAVEYFPPAINAVSYISPIRWAMDCVLKLQAGARLDQVLPSLLVLAGMGVLLLLAAFVLTSRRDKLLVGMRN